MKKENGFTIIEAMVAIVVLIVIGVFFLVQRNELLSTARDQERKTDINTIYSNLKDIYFAEHGYYPTSIDNKILKGLDGSVFIDPNNLSMNSIGSDYLYEGVNCNSDGNCKEFKLSTQMEKEEEYTKTN